jgi:hypothetical protein
MWPRGEVGAGVLVIALSYGNRRCVADGRGAVAGRLNLLCTGLFIVLVKRLIAPMESGKTLPRLRDSPARAGSRRAAADGIIGGMTTTLLANLSAVLAQAPTTSKNVGMPHFDRDLLEVIFYSIAGVCLLIAGYRLGRLVGKRSAMKLVQQKEAELFTAQKGSRTSTRWSWPTSAARTRSSRRAPRP